jgi:hypothetical protein
LGCRLEKVHEFNGNPHFHFPETRSSVRIILRLRFGKPLRVCITSKHLVESQMHATSSA